jgi:hypothetical protein
MATPPTYAVPLEQPLDAAQAQVIALGKLPLRDSRHEGIHDGLLVGGRQAVGYPDRCLRFRTVGSGVDQALLNVVAVTLPPFSQVAA